MELIDIKNDYAKLNYNILDYPLKIADFLVIEDQNETILSQVIQIESSIHNKKSNNAIIKFILNFNQEGNLTPYNGYIPCVEAKINILEAYQASKFIKAKDSNILWGKLNDHKFFFQSPINLIDNGLYIRSDNIENRLKIENNIIDNLSTLNKKVLILDFNNQHSPSIYKYANILKLSNNFRLPFNCEAFDFLINKDLKLGAIENRAIIEGILLELKNYVSSLDQGYLPFETLQSVIDDEYNQNKMAELAIFRNQLLKYKYQGLFAQDKKDFNILNKSIETNDITVVNTSGIDKKFYPLVLNTIISLVKHSCYFLINLDNFSIDDYTIDKIFSQTSFKPIITSNYKFNSSFNIKQYVKNLILFKPLESIKDSEFYTTFLHNLSFDQFIIFGQNTYFLPFIVNLEKLDLKEQQIIQEEIQKDIDKIFTAPCSTATKTATNKIGSSNPNLKENNYDNIKPTKYINKTDIIDSEKKDTIINSSTSILTSSENSSDDNNINHEVKSKVIENDTVVDKENSNNNNVNKSLSQTNIDDNLQLDEEMLDIIDGLYKKNDDKTKSNQKLQIQEDQLIVNTLENKFENLVPQENTSTKFHNKKNTVPIYQANISTDKNTQNIKFYEGEFIYHPKYGEGVIEKIISYGDKTLLSIQFNQVGRRLLNPSLAAITKKQVLL